MTTGRRGKSRGPARETPLPAAAAQVLAAAALFLAAAGAACAQSADDFEVKQLPDNTLEITGYKGTAADVMIPSTLYGLKVTAIGDYACAVENEDGLLRRGAALTGVVIPGTVTRIGRRAFWGGYDGGGGLAGVSIGGGCKTIEGEAFAGNPRLTGVVIPDGVAEIGWRAFAGCGLTTLVLGKGVHTIGDEAFAQQRGWASFIPEEERTNRIGELVLPPAVLSVGSRAFEHNAITSLVISSAATKIKWGAFGGNPLARITLPSALEEDTLTSAGFEEGCINFWKNQAMAGGTYVKRGPIWTRE
ncbi:MAG: leucine-rich repeat domain-containing protein [Treponema sp.]|jgi:hypothetical protein|nr:leucine-rich repeat domain-containing protein [Treponema sp.]